MPIVGREAELAAIAGAVRRLEAGEGGFLAFAGDPGIGKTAMLSELREAARRAGVEQAVTVIDDLHTLGERVPIKVGAASDVDRHSYVGIHTLAERALERPVIEGRLLAVAYRPRQLPLPLAAILARAPARNGILRLSPFTEEETRRMVGDRPDAERIHVAAKGVPLYAAVLADDPAASAQLHAELAGLPPVELAVVQAASALGGAFVAETLAMVSDLDGATVRWALDSLVALDILRVSGLGRLLEFRHPALATVAYATTSVSQRRALHLRADRELERRGAPAILRAGHIVHAIDPDGADHPDHCRTLAIAARQAVSTDPEAATGWLETAEVMLARDDPRWRETQLLLGKARLHLGRFDDSRATFLGFADDAEAAVQTGRIERYFGRYPEATAMVRSGLTRAGSPQSRAVGLFELSAIAADCAQYHDSERLAAEAARLARSADDDLMECLTLGGVAWARTMLGDTARARDVAGTAARIADAMVDAVVVQDIECLRLLGQSELVLDRLADARRHLERGVRLARRTGQRHVLPNLFKSLSELEMREGRLAEASQILDEAETLAAGTGVVAIRTLTATLRVNVMVWQRSSAEGADLVAMGERAIATAPGGDTSLPWAQQAHAALGEALIFAGQARQGTDVLLTAGGGDDLPKVAVHRRVRWWELLTVGAVLESDLPRADAYAAMALDAVSRAHTDIRRGFAFRARALADTARGATAAAIAAGETAAASFTAAGALLDLGRTQGILAAAYTAAGRFDDAADRLAIAGGLARRCSAPRLIEQVVAGQARLPHRSPRRDWEALLTPRERDIAVLAGQALASTAIASRLHLSVRTVDSHLGRIYRKLGVANRVALANLLSAGGGGNGGNA